ncbi:MAG TPA: 50S ribosomal protein L4 [Nanoarchaeota archaeon]|nr:50S ribosomal protein L4 [Nanoarchaeota archaeon]
MKTDVLSLEGAKQKEIALPSQFEEEYRPDVIKRAVLVVQANRRQKYGAMQEAGERYSSRLSRRRRQYRGSYGKGISRIQRKIMSRRGAHINMVGAFVPGTVGGRKGAPPKASKEWGQKINQKEKRLAIRSAIAATANREIVKLRATYSNVPLVLVHDMESLSKTQDVEDLLLRLGMEKEVERIKRVKIRAGRGKTRGRRYKGKASVLFVVSGKCPLQNAARNLDGVDVSFVNTLNAELLAPGTVPGRLTIWSEKAIERLAKEKLFI